MMAKLVALVVVVTVAMVAAIEVMIPAGAGF